MDASKTAVVLIEFQNDFTSEGGVAARRGRRGRWRPPRCSRTPRLRSPLRGRPAPRSSTRRSSSPRGTTRSRRTPTASSRASSTPTAFVKGTWGAEIVEDVAPEEGDIVLEGKRGLDAFASTNLDFILRSKGIADGRARRVPHELLRRVDHALGLREGLRGRHADRLRRRHQHARSTRTRSSTTTRCSPSR